MLIFTGKFINPKCEERWAGGVMVTLCKWCRWAAFYFPGLLLIMYCRFPDRPFYLTSLIWPERKTMPAYLLKLIFHSWFLFTGSAIMLFHMLLSVLIGIPTVPILQEIKYK